MLGKRERKKEKKPRQCLPWLWMDVHKSSSHVSTILTKTLFCTFAQSPVMFMHIFCITSPQVWYFFHWCAVSAPAVLYQTLLARTESDAEREAIEQEMREDPEKEAILKTFSEVEAEDLVQEERDRKAAARKSKMETDLIAEDADLQEKKAVGF